MILMDNFSKVVNQSPRAFIGDSTKDGLRCNDVYDKLNKNQLVGFKMREEKYAETQS